MDFWDVVEARHSCRDFQTDLVPQDLIRRCLHAAAAAPSAANEQPWRFHVAAGERRSEVGRLVVQTTVHLSEYMDVLGPERYEDALHWYSSLGDAPVVIGVSMPKPASDLDSTNKLLSVGAAVQNFQLAAVSEGLGTCNITFALWVRDELAEAFELEQGRIVVSLIALGYPSATPPAAPPRNEDVADWLD